MTHKTVIFNHDAAIDEYMAAIDSTLDERRRGEFHHLLARIYDCELGDSDDARIRAEQNYAESERLLDDPLPRTACSG